MSSTSSQSAVYARIRRNPRFAELVSQAPGLCHHPVRDRPDDLLRLLHGRGLPAASDRPASVGRFLPHRRDRFELFMFIFFWVLTAVYVKRANGEFDAITAEVIRDASKEVK